MWGNKSRSVQLYTFVHNSLFTPIYVAHSENIVKLVHMLDLDIALTLDLTNINSKPAGKLRPPKCLT
jgi:hypothetical protein